MPNSYFQFKQFTIHQERCAMKITTDACLFGAWVTELIRNERWATDRPRLLDIGTGTGLLSLMVAQKNSVLIDAIEIEATAADQAKENFSASLWKEQINVVHADVRQWQPDKQYDCIVSNPPFYQNELKSSKENRNIAHHDQGLRLTELFLFVKNHLSKDGCLFLLLPAKREGELKNLLEENYLFLQQKVLVRQTEKHQPFRIMIQARCEKAGNAKEEIISIKNEIGEYTQEFIFFLKNYYLYL